MKKTPKESKPAKAPPKKNKGGRPKGAVKEVNMELVRELASIGCTMPEISACAKVSIDTLERRCMTTIKEGQAEGKQSLRHHQFQVATAGNPTMLIWLGKQYLEQTDKVENTGKGGKDLHPPSIQVNFVKS